MTNTLTILRTCPICGRPINKVVNTYGLPSGPCGNEFFSHDHQTGTLHRYIGINQIDADEVWKAIPNAEGYFVSNYGRVRREYRELSYYERNDGYISVAINRNAKLVHRLVLITFKGFPEKGMETNHRNGIKRDNSLENLEWATPSWNQKHKYAFLNPRKGRALLGKSGWEHPKSHPIGQFNANGDLLDIFGSIAEASRELKIPSTTLSAYIRGTFKSRKSYVFKLLSSDNVHVKPTL